MPVLILIALFWLTLNSASAATVSARLQSNQWQLLSVPASDAAPATFRQLFGSTLPTAEYGSQWVLYSYRPPSSDAAGRYLKPDLDAPIVPGQGYWFIQTSGRDVVLSFDHLTATDTELTQPCLDASACVAVPLKDSPDANTWNLVGFPGSRPTALDATAISTSKGICQSACSRKNAQDNRIVAEPLWRYNGASSSYESLEGDELMQPWEGFWSVAFSDPVNRDTRWLVPVERLHSMSLLAREGERITLTADLPDSDQSPEVAWTQLSGPPTWFAPSDSARLEFIAPGVASDAQVILQARVVNSADSPAYAQQFVIDVRPRSAPALEAPPRPNVFSSSNIAKHASRPTDDNGIPLLEVVGKLYYYPVTIAAWTYDHYANFRSTGDSAVREQFLKGATWLRDNCVYTQYGFCSFRSYFAQPGHHVDDNWTSAMAQGQALSSLIAAHYLSGDDSFADTAFDALAAYQYPIDAKGLAAELDGEPFFEEYGSVSSPTHVLNGFLFSLSGVHDMITHYNTDLADTVFAKGVTTLANNLWRWDAGFTSRYDLSSDDRFASTKAGPDNYHELHIFQLGWLYRVSGNTVFRDYADRFLQQDMGGLRLVSRWQESAREILAIDASHTIEPVNFGTDRLTDANWTWQKYWSASRFPVTLDVQINPDLAEAGQLESLVLVTVADSDIPTSVDVLEVGTDGIERPLTLGINPLEVADLYRFSVNGYDARVLTLAIDKPVSSSALRLVIHGSQGGNIVRLREIDLHYKREALLTRILGFYGQ